MRTVEFGTVHGGDPIDVERIRSRYRTHVIHIVSECSPVGRLAALSTATPAGELAAAAVGGATATTDHPSLPEETSDG